MAGVNDLAGMVPGFEFLQTLMKTASAALPGVPGMSQWIAPTLDPEELEKRIQELKTVQFWLEQNAKLLGGTIQALEVQRMTLSTLKSMNLQMGDLQAALKIKPAPAQALSLATEPPPVPPPASAPEPAAAAAAAPAVDPLQWWGALTQQFAEIATKAVANVTNVTDSTDSTDSPDVTDSPADVAKPPAAAAPAAAASRKRRS